DVNLNVSEGDGTRTRNHRIDSPDLMKRKMLMLKGFRPIRTPGCSLVALDARHSLRTCFDCWMPGRPYQTTSVGRSSCLPATSHLTRRWAKKVGRVGVMHNRTGPPAPLTPRGLREAVPPAYPPASSRKFMLPERGQLFGDAVTTPYRWATHGRAV